MKQDIGSGILEGKNAMVLGHAKVEIRNQKIKKLGQAGFNKKKKILLKKIKML